MVIFHVTNNELEGDAPEAEAQYPRVAELRATGNRIGSVIGRSSVACGYISQDDTLAFQELSTGNWVGLADENVSTIQWVTKRLGLAANSKEEENAS